MERSAIWLLGRDFTELGPLGLAAHSLGGAIVISRGRLPKPYPHVDPNEDTGLIVHTSSGVMLAVADGFNGTAASELSLEAIRQAAEELTVEDPDAFEDATCETVRRLASAARNVAPSSTCLVVLAVCGRTCHVANFGDSAAFRAGAQEALVPPNDLVLGPALATPALRRIPFAVHFERNPGERVAVVSDGVTAYVRDTREIPAWLAEARTDRDAAQRIAEGALLGGAGDNVSVVAYGGTAPDSD